MIRALIRNPNTGRSCWFEFPLYFGKLIEIGCSGNYKNMVEVLEVEGTTCFSVGYYTLEELEYLNRLAIDFC